jgi:hypothetical protein
MMYKTLHRKLKLEQYEHAKKIRELTQVFRKCWQHLSVYVFHILCHYFWRLWITMHKPLIGKRPTWTIWLIYINVCIFHIYLTPENATYFIKFCQSHWFLETYILLWWKIKLNYCLHYVVFFLKSNYIYIYDAHIVNNTLPWH